MFAARRLAASVPRAFSQRALFHNTAPAFVQKGDAIPDLDVLVENSPGNKVNLAKELKGKGVIIGVPAAFSTYIPKLELKLTEIFMRTNFLTLHPLGPACSSTHVPGYISHPKLKQAGQVFVVAVNDPFVYASAQVLDVLRIGRS